MERHVTLMSDRNVTLGLIGEPMPAQVTISHNEESMRVEMEATKTRANL